MDSTILKIYLSVQRKPQMEQMFTIRQMVPPYSFYFCFVSSPAYVCVIVNYLSKYMSRISPLAQQYFLKLSRHRRTSQMGN